MGAVLPLASLVPVCHTTLLQIELSEQVETALLVVALVALSQAERS